MPRILLVKTSSMGDIIHNMPLIADVRRHYPDAIIDWVVEETFAEIAALCPHIDQLIILPLRRWKKNLSSRRTWREFLELRRKLKAQRYDAILDTQALLKSAFISTWARGPSHGPNCKTAREPLAGLLYTYGYDISPKLHAVTRTRLVAATAFGYNLEKLPLVYDLRVPQATLPIAPPSAFVLGFHSTARDAKLWPVTHWIALGKHLASRGLSLLLPWGSEAERVRAVAIAQQVPDAVVLPKMSLSQLTCLIQHAKLTVGLDTGLMHIAVALDIPTLAIFCDTHIWQAGAMPAASGRAITIGGKPALPRVEEAVAALDQLLG